MKSVGSIVQHRSLLFLATANPPHVCHGKSEMSDANDDNLARILDENGDSLNTPLLGESSEDEVLDDPELEDVQNRQALSDHSGQTSTLQGQIILVIVSFLYATFNISLRFVYSLPGPPSASAINASRQWMVLVSFLPLTLCREKPRREESTEEPSESTPRSIWIAGAELAFWNFASLALFTLGLLTTPSARASFFGQTGVVLVPLISALLGEKLRFNAWLGCLTALLGLFLLSHDETSATSVGFGIGDLLVLGGTVLWSLYIVRLSRIGGVYDEIYLQGIKNFYLPFYYSAWFLIATLRTGENLWPGWDNLMAWVVLGYSAVGPGTVADVLQQKGQKVVAATQSTLILSMEPIFTAILGRVILAEETSWMEKLGGGLLILGALIASSQADNIL